MLTLVQRSQTKFVIFGTLEYTHFISYQQGKTPTIKNAWLCSAMAV